jgi:predicted kinase
MGAEAGARDDLRYHARQPASRAIGITVSRQRPEPPFQLRAELGSLSFMTVLFDNTSVATGLSRSIPPPPTLVVICGLVGAGKTTHARRLEDEMKAVRFCPDEWMQAAGIVLTDEQCRDRIERLQWTLAKRLLSLGQSVLIEWGTWGRSERDRLREEGKSLGARVELHYLTAPLATLLDRVQRRGMEETPITREVMERWARQIQIPTADEMQLFDRVLTIED